MVDLFLKTEANKCKSIQYYTGVETDYGALIKGKENVLYLSSLEKKPKGQKVKDLNFKELIKDLKKYKAISVNFKEITASELKFLKKNLKGTLKDNSEKVLSEREIKNTKEVKKITKAIEITEKIFSELFRNFKKFKTEEEADIFLRKKCMDYGVEPSFPPIVASGNNAKTPHHIPKGKLNKGFCIIDFGVRYQGYCADMTRTIYLGKPSLKEIKFYNEILSNLERLEKEMKPGKAKFETDFKMIHALGHGIGLDVHEAPHLSRDKLKVGQVIAVEPARYSPYGVRIEDNYLVTARGLKKLSSLPRKLKAI